MARDPEPGKTKLFFANPWAMAFTTQSGPGQAYVVSSGSDLLVELNVNANGILSFTGDSDTTAFIDLNDPADEPYWDAVTHGSQALLYTFPGAWGSIQGPYLRLQGQQQLLEDSKSTGFQFLAFEVTTWGGYEEPPDPLPVPNTGPYRQVHTIFNGTEGVVGFYGKNESGDDDIQIAVDQAAVD
jgi:hypothetical protein